MHDLCVARMRKDMCGTQTTKGAIQRLMEHADTLYCLVKTGERTIAQLQECLDVTRSLKKDESDLFLGYPQAVYELQQELRNIECDHGHTNLREAAHAVIHESKKVYNHVVRPGPIRVPIMHVSDMSSFVEAPRREAPPRGKKRPAAALVVQCVRAHLSGCCGKACPNHVERGGLSYKACPEDHEVE